MSGRRVDAYNKFKDMSKWIALVATAFDTANLAENHRFSNAPPNVARDLLIKFAELFERDDVKRVVTGARRFQRDAVGRWNPYINDVTLHSFLGLVAMDEDTSLENMALALD